MGTKKIIVSFFLMILVNGETIAQANIKNSSKNQRGKYSKEYYKEDVNEHIRKANGFIWDAQFLGETQAKVAVRLYGWAEMELRYALNKPSNRKEEISSLIREVDEIKRKARNIYFKYQKKIKKAISEDRVILGMTKEDVKRSLGIGRPDEIETNVNGDKNLSRWKYSSKFFKCGHVSDCEEYSSLTFKKFIFQGPEGISEMKIELLISIY